MTIETRRLRKRFGSNDALKGIDLTVPEGSAYALIGTNGAGKTTTIRILMNMLAATGGSAAVLGVDSRRLGPDEFARIGYVADHQDLPGDLTAGRYIEYLRPFYSSWDRQLETSLIRTLALPVDSRIRTLSHGTRMKLSLVCALSYHPRLLVLDEPLGGLDPLVRDEFLEGLIQQAGDLTILISSHELAEIEGLVTHVGFLDAGRLLVQESMSNLSARLREVRVTLDREAAPPSPLPVDWLQVQAIGNVLSFIDTRFSETESHQRIAASLAGVRGIDARPMPFRTIFTALAHAARSEGA
ncbi:MAG TPA: ABC transporter ATP-binding protein [Povalibacter sp.]|nr:ABC transporter ATP-binding protein [Povalibacter sp.]